MSAGSVRGLHHVVRNALIVSAVIVLALGLDLALLPLDTNRFFSWTIDVPLTAGVLGSFYLAAFVILVLTLAGGMTWARARVVLAGGIVFSLLAIVATVVHADKFHFDRSGFPLVAVWIWTVAYAILTPALLLGLIPQRRIPGADPPKDPPPAWLPVVLQGFGLVIFGTGVALFAIPEQVAKVWPWPLTTLTARVLGAWATGLGLVFLAASVQRDRFRMFPSAVGLGLFGLFQLLTVWRFNSDVAWEEPGAWVYVGFLAAALLVGSVGSLRSRSAASASSVTPAAARST